MGLWLLAAWSLPRYFEGDKADCGENQKPCSNSGKHDRSYLIDSRKGFAKHRKASYFTFVAGEYKGSVARQEFGLKCFEIA